MTAPPLATRRAVYVLALLALILILSSFQIYSDSRLVGLFYESRLFVDNSNDISTSNQTTIQHAKRYFVIHLGPPKTATTSLQMDLTRHSDTVLALDNYTYQGTFIDSQGRHHGSTFFNTFAGTECHVALYEARMNDSIIPECWQTFETELQKLEGKSVVVSSEPWSYAWRPFGTQDAPFDWVGLQDTLKRYNYTLLVVLSYRRLYEFLPSWKQQQDRWRPTKRELNLWPSQKGGKKLQPLFPGILGHPLVHKNGNKDRNTHPILSPLEMSLEMLRTHNITKNVRILNLYSDQYTSALSNFLCSMLPTAHHACQWSIQADNAGQKETRANPQQSLYFDALVTAAAEAGMIDVTRHKRHDVVVATKMLQTQVLNQTARDFPVTCPSQTDLKTLLEASLRQEATILPELHAVQEQRHRDTFWRAVNDHKFCWIDTEATLELDEWNDFFSRYC